MSEDKQLRNLRLLAEALRKNHNLTELSLIAFNDELRKLIVTGLPAEDPILKQMLSGLVDYQTEYATFKTKVLSLVLTLCP